MDDYKFFTGKIDPDVICSCLLFGVSHQNNITIMRGNASISDLNDHYKICIECGLSPDMDLNKQTEISNFDHHQKGGPRNSAAMQIFRNQDHAKFYKRILDFDQIDNLVSYIEALDIKGVSGFKNSPRFPVLSDIISGLLLDESNPLQQLHRGIGILCQVLQTNQNPWGTIHGFDYFANIKKQNNIKVTDVINRFTNWDYTKSRFKIAFVKSDLFGLPSALQGAGADVVVIVKPIHFNTRFLNRVIIASNRKVEINRVLLPIFSDLERGWGGQENGYILSSPRKGTRLSIINILTIIKKEL